MGVSGSEAFNTSKSKGSTGRTTSLSFIPALLSNAFFGTGIGLEQGGFTTTGVENFNDKGNFLGKRATSLVDPFGLGGGSDGDPFSNFTQGEGSNGLGGILNPFDLVSNLTDLANPDINPAIGGATQSLQLGELGSLLGSNLLFGDVGPTLQEGLRTGFKPDLQPVIDEAQRSFFQDIVPQLGQNNVALQEGVGPFSTDLSGQLLNAGSSLASQLGSLEVQNQNLAADRRGDFLGLSSLITDQLFNANTDAGRNQLNLGEQLAQLGTTGGRQATLLQLLLGQIPSGPIQASSQSSSSLGVSRSGSVGFGSSS